MKQSTHSPILITLTGLALMASTHGQIFSDDFESYTAGSELNTSGPWATIGSQEASLTVFDEVTATPFGTPNQYLDFNDISDLGNPSVTVRTGNIAAASGVVTTFAFDFNEPAGGGNGTMIFGYGNKNADINGTGRRMSMNLDDGAITGLSTTTADNSYGLDANYRLYLIFNDSPAAVTYSGGTIAAGSADIWLQPSGGTAVLAGTRVAFNGTASDDNSAYRLAFRSFSTNVQRVLLDNVSLYEGVVLPGNPPTLVSASPADGAAGVLVSTDLVINFDIPVAPGTGNIIIKETSGDATVATIGITDPEVTFSGTTVTVDLSSDLGANTEYYILIDTGAVMSSVGGDFSGISVTTDLSFTTSPDGISPLLVSTTPADDASGVASGDSLVATFDEAISAGTGNIVITNVDASTTFATIDITDATQVTIAGSTLTIDPASDLAEGTNYAVEIGSTSITDIAGNSYTGISGLTTWNFETIADTTDPTLVSTNPTNNADKASQAGNLVANFSEEIQAGTGDIIIRNVTADTIFATIPVGDAQVTIAENTLTINPTNNLVGDQEYAVQIAATAVTDLTANPYAGIITPDVTTWSFTTTRLSSVDYIVGEREASGPALGYYNGSSNVVGVSGGGGSRTDRNVVLGFTLPTLPVGQTAGAADFLFEITAARDTSGAANLPDLQVYLLNTANPDGTGTDFFLQDDLTTPTNAALVTTTSVTVTGTGENTFTDDAEDRVVSLTGDALALLQSFYGGDHIPDQPEAFFAFSLTPDTPINIYRRYRIDLAGNESDLQITPALPATPFDSWAAGFTPNPGAFADNPDSDSLNNLLEFAFGTDPTVSDAASLAADGSVNGLPLAQFSGGAGGVTFEFLYTRRDDHDTAGSVSYTAQFSDDMMTFYDSMVTPSVVADSTDDADYEIVSVAYPFVLPNGKKARFARVKVEITP